MPFGAVHRKRNTLPCGPITLASLQSHGVEWLEYVHKYAHFWPIHHTNGLRCIPEWSGLIVSTRAIERQA